MSTATLKGLGAQLKMTAVADCRILCGKLENTQPREDWTHIRRQVYMSQDYNKEKKRIDGKECSLIQLYFRLRVRQMHQGVLHDTWLYRRTTQNIRRVAVIPQLLIHHCCEIFSGRPHFSCTLILLSTCVAVVYRAKNLQKYLYLTNWRPIPGNANEIDMIVMMWNGHVSLCIMLVLCVWLWKRVTDLLRTNAVSHLLSLDSQFTHHTKA